MSLKDVFLSADPVGALSQLPADEQLLAAVVVTEENPWTGTNRDGFCSLLARVVHACSNRQVTHYVMAHAGRYSVRRHLFFQFIQLLNGGTYIPLAEGCRTYSSNEHLLILVNGAFDEEVHEVHPAHSKVRKLPEALIAMAHIVSDEDLLRASLKKSLPMGVRDVVVTRLAEIYAPQDVVGLLDSVRNMVRDSTWIDAAGKAPFRDQIKWAFDPNMPFVYRVGVMRTLPDDILRDHLYKVKPNVANDIKVVLLEREKLASA